MLRATEAPELPGPDALGLEDYEPLFLPELALERAERLEAGRDGRERWRFPLPGTPGPDGRMTSSPRGAGTGWVELWRWLGSRGWGSRPAERFWNLLCALRAAGVATPMPWLVASRGRLRRSSVLLIRELEEHRSWLATWRDATPPARRRLERALELFLARLARAGVRAEGLELADLRVAPEEHEHGGDEIDCAAKAIVSLREERARSLLAKNRMPSLALVEVAGFELGAWDEASRRAACRRIGAALEEARTSRLEVRLARALSGARSLADRRSFVRSLV